MAFNPEETSPPIDDEHSAIDGPKYGVAIQYTDFNDDKWLISPEVAINETSELSFWGKSITDQYGLERIRVLVSTTGTSPEDFSPISDEPYIEVPTEWTEYSFDLGSFAGETIHIAINYVSFDAFIFMIDAIRVDAEIDPDDLPDELIYSATMPVGMGVQEYKYYSDAFGDGFDGAEFGENREINVTTTWK